jgi:hypothetical protein
MTFIHKGVPYDKPLFIKEVLSRSLYLWKISLLDASVYEGMPYLKLLFIKELLTLSLCEDFIYTGLPY